MTRYDPKTRWMPVLLITLLALFAFTAGAYCASLPTASPEDVGLSSERLKRIDGALQSDIKAGIIDGGVVLVARKGKVAYFKAFGWRDKAKGLPMEKGSIFRIYSMTKPFTSVAVMKLFEEGKLLLSDPLYKYIPAFKDVKVGVVKKDAQGKEVLETEKAKTPITIYHLLTHTSGLSYFFFPPKPISALYLKYGINSSDQTIAEMCEKLAKIPLVAQPGTVYRYSRSFDVLGRVVEVVSGMSFDEFLKERLFDPLGMKDSGFTPTDMKRLVYLTPKDPLYIDFTKPVKFFGGGGSAVSTAEDYARFGLMLLNGGEFNGKRLLGPKTVQYMTSDHLGPLGNRSDRLYVPGVGYGGGFGFYVRVNKGRAPFLGNVGEFYKGGYAGTVCWVDPKEDLVGVLMISAPKHRVRYRILVKTLIYQAIVD